MLKHYLRNIGERAITVMGLAPDLARLKIIPGQAGFFGEVFCVLNGLRLAERHRLAAQVFWGPRSLYYDCNHALAGDAWASFFLRSNFDFRHTSNGHYKCSPRLSVPFKPGAHSFAAYKGLSVRQSVGMALREWCAPHPKIAAEADAVWTRLTQGQSEMLGVHVRLTDAAKGCEGRRTVKLENFFVAADDWLEKHPKSGLFLATDDSQIITAFRGRYGARVVYQDCLRSEDGTSIHGHYDRGVEGSPYRKGREVFLDALLLARCSHLLRTHSRVTAFSLCWAPKLSYRDLEYELTGRLRTPWLHAPDL